MRPAGLVLEASTDGARWTWVVGSSARIDAIDVLLGDLMVGSTLTIQGVPGDPSPSMYRYRTDPLPTPEHRLERCHEMYHGVETHCSCGWASLLRPTVHAAVTAWTQHVGLN
jgi:hypothetical protein